MPGKNERQGRSANIFFFHEDSLQGHRRSSNCSAASSESSFRWATRRRLAENFCTGWRWKIFSVSLEAKVLITMTAG